MKTKLNIFKKAIDNAPVEHKEKIDRIKAKIQQRQPSVEFNKLFDHIKQNTKEE